MIVKLLLRFKLLILTISLATTNIFAQDCESGILNSTTGNWGNEMTWELYSNADDTIIASFQGTQNYTTTEQPVCLEPGCYFSFFLTLGVTVGTAVHWRLRWTMRIVRH